MLRLQDLHFDFLHLWRNAVLSGIAGDKFFFASSFKGGMQHEVDAADGGGAQAGITMTAFQVSASTFHQLLVEHLEVARGQLCELDTADAGNGVLFNHEVISICGGNANVGFGVNFVPASQPCGDRVFLGTADVDGTLSTDKWNRMVAVAQNIRDSYQAKKITMREYEKKLNAL